MAKQKLDNNKPTKDANPLSRPINERVAESKQASAEGLGGFGYEGSYTALLGTTPYGESQYDTDDIQSEYFSDPEILEQIRGERQGWGAELANAIGGGIAKLPFSVIGNVGSMLDFEDYYNTDDEVGNWLTAWAEEKKGNIEEATKIYKSNTNTLGSREWWMQNGKELINSAGAFVATGAGLGAGVNLLSGLAKGSRLLSGAIEGIGTVANATMLNQAESVPIAMNVYQKALEQGKSEAEAADAAAYSININRINIPLNLTSAGAFVRTLPMTRQVAKDFSKKEVLSGILGEGAQEYVEENVNMIAENEALRKAEAGKEYSFNFDRVVDDVLSKEGFEQGLVGFVGGAMQTAGTRLVQSFNKKSLSYDEDGNVKFGEDGKPVFVTERQSQEERFRAQKKNLANIETMAKFEGVPTIKETLNKIRTQGAIQSEMQEAALKGDQARLDVLKNDLLTNQAASAFKTGTTGQLIEMYQSISRDPNGKSKYGDDYMANASEAIKTIESLEKVYLKYATLPQVDEILDNRSRADFNLKQIKANKSAMLEAERRLQAEIEATGFNTPELVSTLSSAQELGRLNQQQQQLAANMIKTNFEFNQITSPDYVAKKRAAEEATQQAQEPQPTPEQPQPKAEAKPKVKPTSDDFNPFEGAEDELGTGAPATIITPDGKKKTEQEIIAETLTAEDLKDEFSDIEGEDMDYPADEGTPVSTEKPTISVSDIEAKKADIERRRQKELTKGINEFNKAKNKEELTKAVQEWVNIDPYNTEFVFLNVRAALTSPGGFEKGKEMLYENHIKPLEKFVNNRINAKYDAELDALKGKDATTEKNTYTVKEVQDRLLSLAERRLIVDPTNKRQYIDPITKETWTRVTSLQGKDINQPEAADRGGLIDSLLRDFIDGRVNSLEDLINAYANNKSQYPEAFDFNAEFLNDLYNIFNEVKNQGVTLLTNIPTLWGTVNGTKVAGTVDLLGITPEGKVYIIDLKTSTQNRRDSAGRYFESYKKSDSFQQSYYAELLRQRTGINISNLTILPVQTFKTKSGEASIYNKAIINKKDDGSITMGVAIDRSIFPDNTIVTDEPAFDDSKQVGKLEEISDTSNTENIEPDEVEAEMDIEGEPDLSDFEPDDQNMANEFNSRGAEFERAPEVKLDFGDRLVSDKEFSGHPTAGMMSLYEGYKTTGGYFIWDRDEDGMPIATGSVVSPNVSKSDVGLPGSKITFKVVELPANQQAVNQINIEKSRRTIFDDRQTDNLYGYTDEDGSFDSDVYTASIAAVDDNNNILFFVPLPHAITKNTTVDTKTMVEARKRLIAERTQILNRIATGNATTTIKEKGHGKIFNQVDPKTNRPIVKIDGDYVNLFEMGLRPEDMVNGRPVFAYGRGTSFVVPILGDPDMQEEIESAVARLGDTAKAGNVYMLVKGANNSWMPVPVFTTTINEVGARDILNTINKFNEGSDFNTIVSELQDKIFVAGYLSGKKAPIRVISPNEFESWRFVTKDNMGNDIFYTLNDLKTNPARQQEFMQNLMLDKRNNIDVKKLNSSEYQSTLKNKVALTTNARLDASGSYFVQPYITWNPLVSPGQAIVRDLQQTASNNIAETPDTNSDKEFENKIGYDPDIEYGAAFSKKANQGTALDRSAFKQWLNEYLPGLSVSDVDQVAEVKGTAKDSVGMFHNMVIYLFQGATNKTAYHEAFHGVFRNMLSKESRLELINEAKQKYKAPTQLDLDAIQIDLDFPATPQQLENIYYEEQMADDFAEYVDKVVPEKTIFNKIADFFKRILNYFKLISNTSPNKIEEVFDKILAKKFKKASMDARAIQDIVDRRIAENFAPAYSKIKGLTIRESSDRTRALVTSFMVEFQKARAAGVSINADEVFKKLYQHYADLNEANKLDPKVDKEVAGVTLNVLRGFDELVTNAKKTLKTLGFKNLGKNENISFTEGVVESDKDPETEEVSAEDGKTSRDFGMDLVTMPGVKSATVRMKLFLGAIPVLKNGNPQVDKYKLQQFYDFKSTYYYIERVLVGHNTIEEMLKTLKKLASYKPELQQVIDTLEGNNPNYTGEELESLRADFRANFSKQMLGYVVAKVDFGPNNLPIIDIFESNRNNVGRQIFEEWTSNLESPTRTNQTIGELNNDGTVTINGTEKAKVLYEFFLDQIKNKTISADLISKVLNRVGVVLSPEVITTNANDPAKVKKLASEISNLLKFYSQTVEESAKTGTSKVARDAKWYLVGLQEAFDTHQYTSSFNNVENSIVYAVQNPSYMSKLFSKLTNPSEAKYNEALVEYREDPFYKYNNLLNELSDPVFRTQQFKMFYLDGLTSVRSSRKGKKFTSMNSEDFIAMELALFMNNTTNKQKTSEKPTAKYMSTVPSDKTMVTIVEGKRYGVDAKFAVNGNDVVVSVSPDSEIVDKFYNSILNEANRIKSALDLKGEYERLLSTGRDVDRLAAEDIKENLRKEYHFKKSPTDFDGNAFKFVEFPFLNKFLPAITEAIKSDPTVDIKTILDEIYNVEEGIKPELVNYLNKLARREFAEMISKNVFSINKEGAITPIKMDVGTSVTQEQLMNIIVGFTLNKSLNLIDTENLLNGDPSYYKNADLELLKRFYQKQSMTVSIDPSKISNKSILVTSDVEDSVADENEKEMNPLYNMLEKLGLSSSKLNKIKSAFSKPNRTDAQVWIDPLLWKELHQARGSWNPNMDLAYKIGMGEVDAKTVPGTSWHRQLAAIKPFGFGLQLNPVTNSMEPIQLKCSMMPLFPTMIKGDALLENMAKTMKDTNTSMIATKSSLKAMMPQLGTLDNLEGLKNNILEFPFKDLGFQVDNPDHLFSEENDALRQMRMLMLGMIDPKKSYRGEDGDSIINRLVNLESAEVLSDLNELIDEMTTDKDDRFKKRLTDALTMRNSNRNIEKVLEIKDGKFSYPLSMSNVSTEVQNLISSIFTKGVVKQGFLGGSAVQASDVGFTIKSNYKNLKSQQEDIDKNPVLQALQKSLKYLGVEGKDGFERIVEAQAIMPAWAEEFYTKNPATGVYELKNSSDIPAELRELIVYRIPYEGPHSTLPIKVVKFLPPEAGNFIILPGEIVAQFGSDFDFDKMYFIGRHSYTAKDGKLYVRKPSMENKKDDTYMSWSPEERQNEIFDIYWKLLTSPENLQYMMTPSGFEELAEISQEINKLLPMKLPGSYYTGATQRLFKDVAHSIISLKGQSVLHGTGHAYASKLNLDATAYTREGKVIPFLSNLLFNNKTYNSFSRLYDDKGDLITDELMSMTAAILDAIKNPQILHAINITNDSIDLWGTIVRSGAGTKTASYFTAQPIIREITSALKSSRKEIRGNEPTVVTKDTIFEKYQERFDQLLDIINSSSSASQKFFSEYDNVLGIVNGDQYGSLTDKYLNKYVGFSHDFTKESMTPEEAVEEALFLRHQIRVGQEYVKIDAMAKGLVKINRFLSINKEVGPDLETILDKIDLLDEISSPDFVIKGFNTKELPILDAYVKALYAAKDKLAQDFPEATDAFQTFKDIVASEVTNTGKLSDLSIDDKKKISKFFKIFTERNMPMFEDIATNERRKYLLWDFPSLIMDIKNPANDAKFLNGRIRTSAVFQNLKVERVKDKNFNYISIKANRLDPDIKNVFSESLLAMSNVNDPFMIKLVKDLVDHSMLTTGLSTGLNSYHTLIDPEILAKMGYVDQLDSYMSDYQQGIIPGDGFTVRALKQFIQNNAKSFVRTYNASNFVKLDDNTYVLNPAKASSDVFNSVFRKEMPREFIQIFESGKPTKLLQLKEGYIAEGLTYEVINYLGTPGKLIEIDTKKDINASFIKANNRVVKSNTNKPTTQPAVQPIGKIKPENISSKGSEFAKKLTNVGNTVGLTYKGKQYVNSEHAYQTWKSGEFNQAGYDLKGGKVRGGKIGDTFSIMTDILTEKLKQHPDLVQGINERGGLTYIEQSTHNVIGDKFWESTGQNKFIEALAQAYKNVQPTTQTTKQTIEEGEPDITDLKPISNIPQVDPSTPEATRVEDEPSPVSEEDNVEGSDLNLESPEIDDNFIPSDSVEDNDPSDDDVEPLDPSELCPIPKD